MQRFREITQEDVGRSVFRAFGTSWPTTGFIGRITSLDVGKRVYLVDGILQVENDEQFKQRKAASPTGAVVPAPTHPMPSTPPPPRPTQPSSAMAHIAKARQHSANAQKTLEGLQGGRNPEDELTRVLVSIRDSAAKLPGLSLMQLSGALDDLVVQIQFARDSLEAQNIIRAIKPR